MITIINPRYFYSDHLLPLSPPLPLNPKYPAETRIPLNELLNSIKNFALYCIHLADKSGLYSVIDH